MVQCIFGKSVMKKVIMKKAVMAMIMGAALLTLSSCGQAKNLEDAQTNVLSSTAEPDGSTAEPGGSTAEPGGSIAEPDGSTGEVQKIQNDDIASPDLAELENLTGEYEYLSDYGTGKLMIQKSSGGYDISDYESESSYRFLADSSNIETIENNRIYIKYPEPVFSADKVIFSYYVLEYNSYDVSKPALEIKKNDNETYQIQIDFSGSGIFMIVRGKLRKKDWSLQLQVLVEMK